MAKFPKKKKKSAVRRVFDKMTGRDGDEEPAVAEDAAVVAPEDPLPDVPEVPDDQGDPEPAPEPVPEPEPVPSKPSADPEGAPPARVVRARHETESHVIYVIKPECVAEVGRKKIAIKK